MKGNVVQEKSYAFASRIIKAYNYLVAEQRKFVLSKQLLRSDTSLRANVEEALAASSTADFVNKLTIAAKEARETSIGCACFTTIVFCQRRPSRRVQGQRNYP